jgi:acetolactate synthase-1/2/3 large subunit
VLLAVGTRFTELETAAWSLRLPDRVAQIDVDSAEIGRNYPVVAGVVGDARLVLEQLAELVADTRPDRGSEVAEVKRQIWQGWQQRAPEALRLVQTLRAVLPRNAVVVNDLTVAAYWAQVALPVYEPRTYLFPYGFAPLGFAVPAAIGAKLARPDRPVVAIAGDGGFLFTCQELATAVQFTVPLVVLVFNDNAFGVLRPQQQQRYGRTYAVDLVNPDFVALAQAFGLSAQRVHTVEQLGEMLTKAVNADCPWLIEFPISLPWPV